MAYTLEHNGVEKTLAEWGADDSATLSLLNQSAGLLTLHFPGWLDEDVPFAFRDKVVLRLNGEVIWRGHADAPVRSADGQEEGISMQFFDAWRLLEMGTIAQTIYDGAQGAAARTGTLTNGSADVVLASTAGLAVGMLVLGDNIPANTTILSIGTGMMTMSADATAGGDFELRFIGGTTTNTYGLFASIALGSGITRLSVNLTLQAIISACDAHYGSGVIAYGGCDGPGFSILPLPVDIQGTFDVGIKTALKFVPDAVSWINYVPDPPQIHFTQRVAGIAKTLAMADGRLMVRQQIQARPDLLVTGVRIIYKYYRVLDGSEATSYDAVGDTGGPGVIQVEFDLRPPTEVSKNVAAVEEQQYLESDPVLENDPEWWFKNANTGASSADDITIVSEEPEGGGTAESTAKVELDPDAPENADAEDLTDVAGCTRRIIQGNIPGWLNVNAHLRYIRVSAVLKIKVYTDPADPDKGYTFSTSRKQVNMAATDLGTNVYTNEVAAAYTTGGSRDGESPPTGVAAAIYAALNVLQYEGAVSLTDDEPDFTFRPGQVLNITGSEQTEWDEMRAQIQGVSFVLQAGTTIITTGPAEHLAPQDFLEIIRAFGKLTPSKNLNERADNSEPEEVGGGTISHPAFQSRFGISSVDNVDEKRDSTKVDETTGYITRKTLRGEMEMSDGTTTVKFSSADKVVSITDGSKSITLALASLPAGADMRARELPYCGTGGESLSAWFICTEPA